VEIGKNGPGILGVKNERITLEPIVTYIGVMVDSPSTFGPIGSHDNLDPTTSTSFKTLLTIMIRQTSIGTSC
jgi:hypothetical protein